MQLAFILNHFLCAVVKVQLLNPENDTELNRSAFPLCSANFRQHSVDAVRLCQPSSSEFDSPRDSVTLLCYLLDSSWTTELPLLRFFSVVSTSRMKLKCFHSRLLLRKEVIQPHLPIRLPCYDFTPVIGLTFDGWLLAVTSPASGAPNSHGVTGGVYKARERIHRGMLIRDY